MTGLNPVEDRILEIGAIATDWDFREIARFLAPVKVDPKLMKRRMVGEFWESNSVSRDGLIAQNQLESTKPSNLVEKDILKFIDDNFDTEKPIYLAGNSIHQDQKFIEREWPQLNKILHYRQLDVSAWKVVFENKFGKKFSKPEVHRAIDDIVGSIEELKYYLKKVKP